ncbi:hypothetical protein EGI22_05390, partial [Lacihabitans sp. LS3-19]|uniref:Ig-like domain-containing protein n=1 Tax=Lacihabitans sp. LS3-19 TaxID=2487335 RepID=UPI0020CD62F2
TDDTNAAIASTAGASPINALAATDTDGTIVSYTISSLPTNGILALAGTPVTVGQILTPVEAAALTYDPSGTFVGTDSFTFTATDNNGADDTTPATVSIPVGNNPPVAISDTLNAQVPGSNAVINIIANDTLVNGNPSTPADVIVDINPSIPGNNDTLIVSGEGVWTYNPATGELTFNPEVGFTTDPSPITYILTEISTGLQDTVNVIVEYVEVEPLASDDSVDAIPVGTDGVIDILSNDNLSDGSSATISTVSVDLTPLTPLVDDTLIVFGEGMYVYNPTTGEITFTPEVGFTGNPTTIQYVLIENITGLKDTANISISYSGNPIAINDADMNNLPGMVGIVNALANDTLSTGLTATPSTASVDLIPSTPAIDDTLIVAGEGMYVYNPASGLVSFTPESGFTDNPTPIVYKLIETLTGFSDQATITMTYLLPIKAINDTISSVPSGVSAVINIVSNDTLSSGLVADPLEVTVDLNPLTPETEDTLVVTGEGSWIYNPSNGELTFTPEPTFTGNPSPIEYLLTEDATGLTDTATVFVEYLPLNPIAVNDESLNNLSGIDAIVNILANDTLNNGSPAIPSLIYIDLNPATPALDDTLIVAGEGMFVYNPFGEVSFIPEPGFVDSPSVINYVLEEISTGFRDTASITITYLYPIEPVNDESLDNTPGVNAVINIISNDTLANGSPATPSQVLVDLNPGLAGNDTSLAVPGEGIWIYNPATGLLTFDPVNGFSGSPTPIVYTLTEIANGYSKSASVSVQYAPGQPPAALDDSSLGNMPTLAAVLNILTNDTLSTGLVANTSNANVDLDPSTPTLNDTLLVSGEGQFVYNPSTGELTFTPQVGFTGNPTQISYVLVEITTGLKDTANININYLQPIDAINDSNTGNVPGVNAVFNIVLNDTLSDGNAAIPSEVTVDLDLTMAGIQTMLTVTGQGLWTYNATSGNITFNPEIGFTTDPTSISYVLTEISTGMIDTAIINVQYTEIPPIANSDSDLTNDPQMPSVINLLINDKLSDGSPALLSKVSVDLEPTVAGIQTSLLIPGEGVYAYNNTNGNLTFTPQIGFYANPTPLVYGLVETLTGLSDTALVTIQYQFNPSLELIKIGTLMGPGAVGDSIEFSFTVINTGNVPVTGITINDAMISPNPISVTPSSLAPGGTGVAIQMYYLTLTDIMAKEVINSALVNGMSSNGIAVKDTSDNGDPGMPGGSNATRLALPSLGDADVKLTGDLLGACDHLVGDTVTYVVKVFREDTLSLPLVLTVKDSIGTNFQLISQVASEGSYNAGTNLWSGISINKGDTATITFQYKILTNAGGLTCVESWVEAMSLNDVDSNPGDKVTTEDDIARACVSIPIAICPAKSETVELSAPLGYTSYQWYNNGALISGAISDKYTASVGGAYTVIVDGGTCPNSYCCPINVQEICPCPVNICIPISIKKN